MKSTAIGLTLLITLLAQVAVPEKAPPKESEHEEFSRWMDVKVKESQKVFLALAQADFDAIIASTTKLRTLNTLEGFVRRTTPGYRTQLRAFEFAVDEIQRQARRENLEGATMGFHQLTLSCVNCHKQLRRPTQAAAAPRPSETDP